jgi:membrane-associated phospholipid phosphatase
VSVTGAGDENTHPLLRRGRDFVATAAAWIGALAKPMRVSLSSLAFIVERQRLRTGAIAVLLIAVASMGWGIDTRLIAAAGHLPAWLVDTFNEITDYGRSSWTLWPSGLLFLGLAAAATSAATRISRLVLASIAVRSGFVFLAIGIPGLVVSVGKRWIGRARPSDAGAFAYHPFSWVPDYASFPSGHSAAAFSALVALGAIFPRARWALWIYAITIALSRMIIAAHYPSDVIVGAMVGASGAILVREWFASRRLGFYVGRDGRVHAMAGPSFRRIKRVAEGFVGQ